MSDPRIKKGTEHLRFFPEATMTLYQRQVIEKYYREIKERTEFENRRLGRAILTER